MTCAGYESSRSFRFIRFVKFEFDHGMRLPTNKKVLFVMFFVLVMALVLALSAQVQAPETI